jgi:hypothetical protein
MAKEGKSMNKKQKAVFLVGVGLIVLMGLIPPWYYDNPETDQRPKKIYGGYAFLFSPSPPPLATEHAALSKVRKEVTHLMQQGKEDEAFSKFKEVVKANNIDPDEAVDWFLAMKKGLFVVPHIDLSRLLVQWAVVAIAIAGIVVFLKDDTARSQNGG